MPKMDGVETVVAMRKDRHVPTVLVTAFDESEIKDRMEEWNMGHVEYLRKPFTQSDLRAALARVLHAAPAG